MTDQSFKVPKVSYIIFFPPLPPFYIQGFAFFFLSFQVSSEHLPGLLSSMQSWQLGPSGYKNRQGIDNVTGMKTNVDVAMVGQCQKHFNTKLQTSVNEPNAAVKLVVSQLSGTIKLQSLLVGFFFFF